ncbi:MAG: RnfH family protein [Gammaproteobacteria bacterium]|nr:RnfH family protein [Gammaproteobacteria bacterium]
MENNDLITVECVYASKSDQYFITLKLKPGACIEELIEASGVLSHYPELTLGKLNVGIFGQKKALTDPVRQGDRVEIYRPLMINPMEARRTRAITPKKNKRKSWKIVVI